VSKGGGRGLARQVLFKAKGRLRRWYDDLFGWRSAAAQQERWARAWQATVSEPAAWLERPGAGRFWMSASAGRRWARLHCSPADLETADLLRAGRIRLLGPDPVRIGSPPEWGRDLYSGKMWPARPAWRIPLELDDGSDIRTVWELSRGYHLVTLAKAFRRSGDSTLLDLVRSHLESWLAQNPPGVGPNWMSPMDVAIRSANWMLCFQLLADAPGLTAPFWSRVLANLRLSAWFIERNPEWRPTARGNHYVANGVGLVYLGSLFFDEPDGRRWLQMGARILGEEIALQVGPDGVSYEAALGYHRLVTEFFTYGGELVRLNAPGALPAGYWEAVRRMYGFLAGYLPESEEAPMLGDADDGRLHALCWEAMDHPRRHRLGLPARHFPSNARRSTPYRNGGYFVIRGNGGHAVVRCGPVGLGGAGSHDHNDHLSLELVLGGVRLVADSGTFAYTRDLAERYAFRSTASHSVPQLGGEEQNPIAVDRPWRVLADRTRSECTAWEVGEDTARFQGRHFGYHHRASRAVCSRVLSAVFSRGDWRIEDTIEGEGIESVAWRLHLVPGTLRMQLDASDWVVHHSAAPGVEIRLATSAPLTFSVAASRMSDRYGQVVERPVLLLEGRVPLPARISCRFAVDPRSATPSSARSSPPDR